MVRMRRIPADGVFRNPQSFTLLVSHHMLEKLRWELDDLRQTQWDESLDNWRQVVSYKAINFATTAWHLIEWIDEDTRRAIIPRAALGRHLNLDLPSDPPTSSLDRKRASNELKNIRAATLERCADLEICRVIATSSKHYEVRDRPNRGIRTHTYYSTKTRAGESFQRPFMFLQVVVDGESRSTVDVFEVVLRFWEETCRSIESGGEMYERVRKAVAVSEPAG